MRKATFYLICIAGIFTGSAVQAQDIVVRGDDHDPLLPVRVTVLDDDSSSVIQWHGILYEEVYYDDGEAEDFALWADPGSVNAVKLHPFALWGYPCYIKGGQVYVGDGTFPGPFLGSRFSIAVYDDDGVDGMPGTILDSIEVEVNNYGWVEFYFPSPLSFITDDFFYLGMIQTNTALESAPLGIDNTEPLRNRSYSRFQQNPWVLSSYQDMMIRAYVGTDTLAISSVDYSRLVCFSDFDPEYSPILGTITHIIDTNAFTYEDTLWGDLPRGWYAYGVKLIYLSGDSSGYYISNVKPHKMVAQLDVHIMPCDESRLEYLQVTFEGLEYPYSKFEFHHTTLSREIYKGIYRVNVYCPGNETYTVDSLEIFENMDMEIHLDCIHYPARDPGIDPVTAVVEWEEPRIELLYESFEGSEFPPPGWRKESYGAGWFATGDGSGGGWTIPPGDGKYACTNDLIAPLNNDGRADYLVTFPLKLDYAEQYLFEFSTFFDGLNGQLAVVKYSLDDGENWYWVYKPSAADEWENISRDISVLNGPDQIWFAFHSSDLMQLGSGWAVDNVRIYSPEVPAMLMGYEIYLNGSYAGFSDTNVFFLDNLVYGEEYEVCIRGLYPSGLSSPECLSFQSLYQCNPPVSLSAEIDESAQCVELSWDPPEPDPAGYHELTDYVIYRSVNGGEYDLLVTIDSSSNSYCDVPSGDVQCYKVLARYANKWDTCASGFSDEACQFLAIPEPPDPGHVQVFPNPVTNIVYISSSMSVHSLRLYNHLGQMVFSSSIQNPDQVHIDVSIFPEGIYYLKVQTSEGVYFRKIVVVGKGK